MPACTRSSLRPRPPPPLQDAGSQYTVTVSSAGGAAEYASLPDPLCSSTDPVTFCPDTASVRVRVECSEFADTPCRLQLAVYSDSCSGGGGSSGGEGDPTGDGSSYQSPTDGYDQSPGVTGVTGSGASGIGAISTTTWIIIGAAVGGALLAAVGEGCRGGVGVASTSAVLACMWAAASASGPHLLGIHTTRPSAAAAHSRLPPIAPAPPAGLWCCCRRRGGCCASSHMHDIEAPQPAYMYEDPPDKYEEPHFPATPQPQAYTPAPAQQYHPAGHAGLAHWAFALKAPGPGAAQFQKPTSEAFVMTARCSQLATSTSG